MSETKAIRLAKLWNIHIEPSKRGDTADVVISGRGVKGGIYRIEAEMPWMLVRPMATALWEFIDYRSESALRAEITMRGEDS
jgi:hypothetical protein